MLELRLYARITAAKRLHSPASEGREFPGFASVSHNRLPIACQFICIRLPRPLCSTFDGENRIKPANSAGLYVDMLLQFKVDVGLEFFSSVLATTAETHMSPVTFTEVRAMSRTASIPATSPMPSIGRPAEVRTMESMMSPAPGTPAVPIDASVAVIRIPT